MIADQLDQKRREVASSVDRGRKSIMGQFLTPGSIAWFMASLFEIPKKDSISILDAGAGIGSLAGALLERLEDSGVSVVNLTAYELDKAILPHLNETLRSFTNRYTNIKKELVVNTLNKDFIESGRKDLFNTWPDSYDMAILNPPYGKINSNSHHRTLLRQYGIETVNLYSAFVALALKQLSKGGQIVAIIPRSFCNGPYYKPFRQQILSEACIQYIHLFDSRKTAFADDGVLQENIILHLIKGKKQTNHLSISNSHGVDFDDVDKWKVRFENIVKPGDVEVFIHIPNDSHGTSFESQAFAYSLDELGVSVSTGPVVDFRLKEYLSKTPGQGRVPLLYPAHFSGWNIAYPLVDFKKYNAIAVNEQTKKWLFPSGFYTVVRRFSSKEEKRRIIACVVRPEDINAEFVGLENHVNVFHHNHQGLAEDLAFGLAAYLNSKQVDTCFRVFSGHTQVNATDLRLMKYPSVKSLTTLGNWAKSQSYFDSDLIDARIEDIL
ncbi:MAG TPA: N-6 DNA methylase [Saprospiraceae bacterium]|nr:N-6 DNA methylase [Saprospiraceae bacterium]